MRVIRPAAALALLALSLLAPTTASAQDVSDEGLTVYGQADYDWTIRPLEGDPLELDAFRGRVFALEFLGMTLAFSVGGIVAGLWYDWTGSLTQTVYTVVGLTLASGVLWSILVEAGHIVASILMLIVAATMYSRRLGISGLPNELGELIAGANIGLYGILAVYVVVLIILSTILDTTSIILIMVPLFLPVLAPFGVDLVWFGIITIVGAEIGLLTPPLGISCYVIKSTLHDDRISLYDVFAGAFPFAVMMLLVLILLIMFPQLSLVLV